MTQNPRPAFLISPISPLQTHALRHAVLRPHQRIEQMVYPGDDLPTTVHLGAFPTSAGGQHDPAGIVTLSIEPMPDQPCRSDWRLRGMAVAPAFQGRGLGQQLVAAGLQAVAEAGGQRVWCNARLHAAGFYQRMGFARQGEVFEIDGIGPHVVMWIAAGPGNR